VAGRRRRSPRPSASSGPTGWRSRERRLSGPGAARGPAAGRRGGRPPPGSSDGRRRASPARARRSAARTRVRRVGLAPRRHSVPLARGGQPVGQRARAAVRSDHREVRPDVAVEVLVRPAEALRIRASRRRASPGRPRSAGRGRPRTRSLAAPRAVCRGVARRPRRSRRPRPPGWQRPPRPAGSMLAAAGLVEPGARWPTWSGDRPAGRRLGRRPCRVGQREDRFAEEPVRDARRPRTVSPPQGSRRGAAAGRRTGRSGPAAPAANRPTARDAEMVEVVAVEHVVDPAPRRVAPIVAVEPCWATGSSASRAATRRCRSSAGAIGT
jgi:hypothetical protein